MGPRLFIYEDAAFLIFYELDAASDMTLQMGPMTLYNILYTQQMAPRHWRRGRTKGELEKD